MKGLMFKLDATCILIPKMNSTFEGINAYNWIKKCVKYFSLYRIPNTQKVDLASMFMQGRVKTWFESFSLCRKNMQWENFVVDACARFKNEMRSRVIENFSSCNNGVL